MGPVDGRRPGRDGLQRVTHAYNDLVAHRLLLVLEVLVTYRVES